MAASANSPSAAASASGAAAHRSGSKGLDGFLVVHCLMAMIFAGLALLLLGNLGIISSSKSSLACACSNTSGYTWCAVVEDLRSVLSFVLGAYICSCLEDRAVVHPLELLRRFGLCRKRSATAGGRGQADGAETREEILWKGNILTAVTL
eukprot:CAMPEP_0183516078 /NCGR_PEP_ID=MMETSP0371-20130417/13941_1 /TAXON_ID=268820 /ORGANISM="Peridinium aciculiferum, Strain PAER-2" /LENGTH=149 /DNA_ID=CAMNT_0025713743 /DNA_START=44 /DNA_END=493 /DNA_ORIENTATION=-